MQAPQSSTASGEIFRTRSLTALLSASSYNPTGQERSGDGSQIEVEGEISPLSGPSHKPPTNSLAESAGLAHDAGNLLGALGLYSELLAMPGVLRKEHRHYAEELRLLSGRSRKLIGRLLESTTVVHLGEQSLPATRTEQLVVPDVIESCHGILNAVAHQKIAVAYEDRATQPIMMARESLERILVNLVKNAAEATEEIEDQGGQASIMLRVSCRQSGPSLQQIVLTVEDKGRGMDTAMVRSLLGQNGMTDASVVLSSTSMSAARSATSRRQGIGFQVVRELVRTSGGQISLSSRSGGRDRGTTVAITWPVAGTPERSATNTRHRQRSNETAQNGQTWRVSC